MVCVKFECKWAPYAHWHRMRMRYIIYKTAKCFFSSKLYKVVIFRYILSKVGDTVYLWEQGGKIYPIAKTGLKFVQSFSHALNQMLFKCSVLVCCGSSEATKWLKSIYSQIMMANGARNWKWLNSSDTAPFDTSHIRVTVLLKWNNISEI